jgi:predicted translin family RNA/ssDNA-binding protein
MLNKKYFQKIREELVGYAEKRREVIKTAGDAQHHAKRAIFALQRAANKEADESLGKAKELLQGLQKRFAKEPDLFTEGSYRAALEEYVEALLFQNVIQGKELGALSGVPVDSDMYISGLCDVPGELVRYATKSATERDFKTVNKMYAAAEAIIAELISMDLTGYHRQKFDQAKQALGKLQQIVYEVSLKQK